MVFDVLNWAIALGAVCELHTRRNTAKYKLSEFVDFEDGRRVVWSENRGFGGMPMAEDEARRLHLQEAWPNPLNFRSGRQLVRDAMLVLDEDFPYDYPDVVLAGLRRLDVAADPISVYTAPFRIEFGPRLEAELPGIIEQSWQRSPPPGSQIWQPPN